jgi:hypothetical protein
MEHTCLGQEVNNKINMCHVTLHYISNIMSVMARAREKSEGEDGKSYGFVQSRVSPCEGSSKCKGPGIRAGL